MLEKEEKHTNSETTEKVVRTGFDLAKLEESDRKRWLLDLIRWCMKNPDVKIDMINKLASDELKTKYKRLD